MSDTIPKSSGEMGSHERELTQLKTDGLHRRLRDQQDLGATTMVLDGRRVTQFASNDYLGLSRHPLVVEAGIDALRKYGNSATASRLICGNHELYPKLEKRLADLKGKAAALVFPTGYMANLGALSALVGTDDLIVMDKLNHASLYDACRLSGATVKRYAHNNLEHLEKHLAQAGRYRRRYIVTDGVFSVDGDLAPLPELVDLARDRDCRLVIDDAHGTGVLGPAGRGTSAHLKTEVPLEIGTLSKGIGALGGFVVADRETIEFLINKARPFIFTTGLPPATLAAAASSLEVMADEPWRQERVLKLAKYVRSALENAGFTVSQGPTPIIPIIIGDEQTTLRMAAACLENNLFVPAVRHPTVPLNQARLRMTLSAAHSDAEVEMSIEILCREGRKTGLI